MAKRKQKDKVRQIIWRLEAAAAVLLVCGCLCVTFLGGWHGIPTWQQLGSLVQVGNFFPAGEKSPAPQPPALPSVVPQSTAAPMPPDTGTPGQTQLHFIDVGQGDAVLIANGGEYALIDCGTEECEDQLLGYLTQLGVQRIALLVMTHPHADHIGSMDAVLRAIPVDTLLLPELTKAAEVPTTDCFARVLDAAGQNGCRVQTGYEGMWYPVGQGILTVLSTGIKTDNYNNISLCTRFDAGDFTFVDTGDAELPVEDRMLHTGARLDATVFKAAHHGSGTSNSLAFLEAVDPEIVVISCGLDNSYGHPHEQPMDNYITVEADIYRTDEQGSVVVSHSPADGVQVTTGR